MVNPDIKRDFYHAQELNLWGSCLLSHLFWRLLMKKKRLHSFIYCLAQSFDLCVIKAARIKDFFFIPEFISVNQIIYHFLFILDSVHISTQIRNFAFVTFALAFEIFVLASQLGFDPFLLSFHGS